MSVTKVYRLDNQPFAQIPNEAIRDIRITANSFRLLAYLMSHADGYELTYSQIERQTGLGRFAINTSIDNLSELGWLRVVRTKKDNGQFGSKAWQVLNPTTVGHSTVEPPHMEPPTDIKNTKEPKNTKLEKYPQAELREAFNNFWNSYPRKVDKLAAEKAFDKAANEYELVDIMAGLQRLAVDPNLPPKQFIPYPASWLKAGGWTNEGYPERQLSKDETEAKQLYEREGRLKREAEQRAKDKSKMDEERATAEKARELPLAKCEHGRIKQACMKCY
jgi:predicted transcriptional regulator